MVSRSKLDEAALTQALQSLPLWTLSPDRPAIVRRFQFADFSTAWSFMTRLALLAEKFDHHPEWSNVYGRVDLLLTTHDVGGITALDIEFARLADQFAAQFTKQIPA
jgi:4a-hydroxytetrahydrobiopterin dehydratase